MLGIKRIRCYDVNYRKVKRLAVADKNLTQDTWLDLAELQQPDNHQPYRYWSTPSEVLISMAHTKWLPGVCMTEAFTKRIVRAIVVVQL